MALINITPIMTSNTAPAPYSITKNFTDNVNYPAWWMFNNVFDSSKYCVIPITTEAWFRIDLGSEKIMNTFIVFSPYNNYSPRHFYVHGSNDGINYTYLTECIDSVGWSGGKSFSFNSGAAYRYYKFTFPPVTSKISTMIIEISLYHDDTITGVSEIIKKKVYDALRDAIGNFVTTYTEE